MVYTVGLAMEEFPQLETLYIEVRGYVEGGKKAHHHNVTLLKELMDMTIQVDKDGEVVQKPIFQSAQLVTRGAAEGCVRVFYTRDDLDVRQVVWNMAHAIVP